MRLTQWDPNHQNTITEYETLGKFESEISYINKRMNGKRELVLIRHEVKIELTLGYHLLFFHFSAIKNLEIP